MQEEKIVWFQRFEGGKLMIPCAKGANARLSLIISDLLYQRSGTNVSACSKQLSTARRTNLLENGALIGEKEWSGKKKEKATDVFRACSAGL